MKKFVLLTLSFVLCLASFSQTIIYVTPGGAGNKSGTSWGNAAPGSQLQSKIEGAANNSQIWIAAGTYIPTAAPAGCENCGTHTDVFSFSLKSGVSLYGGFAGNETTLAQRNILSNVTT